MDWSLLLGILGIVVSIVVGWLTYRLADRRAQGQRHTTAKVTVLQELSKSLGEDSVPPHDILEATIRSVLREIGDRRIEISLEEILDDLVRQVTSDPFLDGERRRKLQGDIQRARAEATAQRIAAPHEEPKVVGFSNLKTSGWSIIAAMLSALGTFAAFFTVIVLKSNSNEALRDAFDDPRVILLFAAFVSIAILPVVLEAIVPNSLRRLFRSEKEKD